jgi:signal peptidase II
MSGFGLSTTRTIAHGPFSRLGLAIALLTCVLDQATKLWLISYYQLGTYGPVRLGPFFTLVLTWNKGISYGWLPQDGPYGPWLLLAIELIAIALLWIWLSRTDSKLSAVALSLIIGGAVGNGIDRLAYGQVADFVFFHIDTATWRFHWYVFNLADVAIVAGVVGLLYESLSGGRAAKAP